jgi:methylated-DNA-[protein]-cysteine S-methyltransferase
LACGTTARIGHLPQLSLHTPTGAVTLSEEEGAIVALDWGWGRDQTETPLLLAGRDWLQRYFDGEPLPMTLPVAPAGTPYRQRVWKAIIDIPWGRTLSYAAVASLAGGSARSIGGAMGSNPVPILIPCHRVLSTVAGRLAIGGYSGGEGRETKRHLLALEGVTVGTLPSLPRVAAARTLV